MKTRNASLLEAAFLGAGEVSPRDCHFALTYRCNHNCPHCYCAGSAEPELPLEDVIRVLDVLKDNGCLWLTLTGGECLVRADFPQIYMAAKKRGFLISVLTNGALLNYKIFTLFKEHTPYSVEITLNALDPAVYNTVTGASGGPEPIIAAIKRLLAAEISVTVKTNCLKTNISQIKPLKDFALSLSSPSGRKAGFMLDPNIFPRLDGSTAPCALRLTPAEREAVYSADPQLRESFDTLRCTPPKAERPPEFLYRCDSWRGQVFITPSGKVRFCLLSGRYSFDALAGNFSGNMKNFERLTAEKFTAAAKCMTCKFRDCCGWCPARAELETGGRENAISSCCELMDYLERHP